MIVVFVHDRAIRLDIHFYNVLLNRHRVVEIAMAIHEFSKARHHIVRDLALRLDARCENARQVVFVTDRRDRALDDSSYVNAKGGGRRFHSGEYYLARLVC